MKKKKLTPADAAEEWLGLKAQQKRVEARLEELKSVLEPELRKVPEKTLDFHGFRFSLVESTRESFSLSKAREKLAAKVLNPFITKSESVSIRTTWQGGEIETAPAAKAA